VDRTSQEKDNLDDFLVLGNHVVEALFLLMVSLLLLEPVNHRLTAFQYSNSRAIDVLLDVLQCWADFDVNGLGAGLELDINFEERTLLAKRL